MLPPLFTQRSPFGFAPMWFWMHLDACRKGSYIAMPVDREPWPDSIEWVTSEPAAQAERFTGREA